jgi:aspartate aminotransferase
VILHGVSKAYAMTGWRIGFCAGPEELIAAMSKIQSQSTSSPSSISQAAAVAALAGDQGCIAPMLAAFRQRHDFLVDRLGAIPGVEIIPGDGTFYAFPDCRGLIERLDGVADDVALASHILDETGVALVPGSAFGAPGCLRLSFATSLDALHEAMKRLHRLLA